MSAETDLTLCCFSFSSVRRPSGIHVSVWPRPSPLLMGELRPHTHCRQGPGRAGAGSRPCPSVSAGPEQELESTPGLTAYFLPGATQTSSPLQSASRFLAVFLDGRANLKSEDGLAAASWWQVACASVTTLPCAGRTRTDPQFPDTHLSTWDSSGLQLVKRAW